MTYKECYDAMLDECSVDTQTLNDLPTWITGGKTPHELMEENDLVMYRCGFNDWLDGEDQFRCDDCHKLFEPDKGTVEQEDGVECPVCAGEAFNCELCGETCVNADKIDDGRDVCKNCDTEEKEENKEEENDE